MSTVKADNFTWKSGQAGGLTGTNVTGSQIVYGVAKAWLNYNASTPAVTGSFNFSSVTKNATGDYTPNFTNAFSDAAYSTVLMTRNGSIAGFYQGSAVTTSFRFLATNTSGTSTDSTDNGVTNFR